MKAFWNWLRSTFEERSGKASSRRITMFWFVVLTTITVLKHIYSGVEVQSQIWMGLLGMILLLSGIVTFEQAIRAWRGTEENEQV